MINEVCRVNAVSEMHANRNGKMKRNHLLVLLPGVHTRLGAANVFSVY